MLLYTENPGSWRILGERFRRSRSRSLRQTYISDDLCRALWHRRYVAFACTVGDALAMPLRAVVRRNVWASTSTTPQALSSTAPRTTSAARSGTDGTWPLRVLWAAPLQCPCVPSFVGMCGRQPQLRLRLCPRRRLGRPLPRALAPTVRGLCVSCGRRPFDVLACRRSSECVGVQFG
jgi:hypothetical protein